MCVVIKKMNSIFAIYFSFTLWLLCINEIKSDLISLLNVNKCYIDKSSKLDMSKINLYFYDYKNQIYINGSAATAVEDISNYVCTDTTRQFVVYVPGYPSDMDAAGCVLSRETFQKIPNTYFMIIDYSAYVNILTFIEIDLYYNAVLHAYAIGDAVGKHLAQIKDLSSYPTKNLYAYGHSFGAQILGYIGEKYYEETNEKIPKITGIDPAAPCFTTSSISDQLRKGVADHVEVYHCSELGSRRNLSDVEYYFDPYVRSRECKNLLKYKEESCIHENCVESWLASVLDSKLFVACSPEDYSEGCREDCSTVTAGFHSSSAVTGVYYASTINMTSIHDPSSKYYYYIFKFFF